MKMLEKVVNYADRLYAELELLGDEVGNIPLTVNEVSEVISELKTEYIKVKDATDEKKILKRSKIGGKLWKAKYLHAELIKRDEKMFLEGEAEVFKVEKLIEQKPSNKALIYKMDVRVGESPFLMRVNVLNINGKNENGESYDYLKIVLPFERNWKEEYKVKGEIREKTVYSYDGMQIDRTGKEWFMDINNSWEDVKGGLLSGFMKVVGIYDREAKRIQREKKAKMKEKRYSQSCKNCRWHISEEVADETESGTTTSFWRHKCVLTGETVDDTAHRFFEEDRKEDKGALQKEAKSIKVNKHSFEEADYRPKTQKSRYIKENALNDFGADCPWHLFHTNFDGSIDDWYSEKPVKGIMPSLQEVYEDEESPVEFMLPNNIIIDFDDIQIVPFKLEEVEKTDKLKVPENMKLNRGILSDEIAKEVALSYSKAHDFNESEAEEFVQKFVSLK